MRLKNKNQLNKIIKDFFNEKNASWLVKNLNKIKIAFGFLNNIQQFSQHSQLNIANSKSNGKSFTFIPPVSLNRRNKYNNVPNLGQHSKIIKKEFS